MNDDFIKKRHKKFKTPKRIIFNIVERVTKENPAQKQRIIGGYDNEVYSIKTEQGNEFIIRINRFGGVGFYNEAWAMKECRKSGVPVPKIFFLGNVEIDGKSYEVMLIERLKGRPLSKVYKKLSPEELNKLLEQAGEMLGKIHSVKVGGFYRRHKDGTWDFPTWDKFMDSTIRERNAEEQYILNAGFTEGQFASMIEMLEFYKTNYPCHQPVLNHGDFLPEHIFVDDGKKISGVIDFGMIEGNTPIHDFAYLNFEGPELNLEALKKGYPDKSLFDQEFDLKINLHKLALQMGHLTHNVKIGDQKQAKSIACRLNNTLRFLKTRFVSDRYKPKRCR